MRPPRLAAWLLRTLLPPGLAEVIAGDLEEEWRLAARPSRRRYWSLALRSIAACAWDRLARAPERLEAASPARSGDGPMHSLVQDVRFGWRMMGRSPGFTAAAVATLALGIGANSAIFSLLSVLSLKPLPYRDPSRVAFVLGWHTDEGMRFNLRAADYLDLQGARSFASVSAYTYLSANLTGGDVPERVQAYRVTANTFEMLGVRAARGRVFGAEDARPGHDDVVVISHGLWQRRFGSDAGVVGRQVLVNGRPCTVIGVTPPRFEFPVFNFKGDLWVPWSLAGAERGQPGALQSATVVGRLREGVTYGGAQAEAGAIMRRIAAAHPDTNRGLGVRVVEMGRLDDEEAGPAMAILLGTVALVLALACANVAHLMLARGVARQRELAVRAALGATRWRIARQFLVEGLLLALAGGMAGALLAGLAVRGLRSALPDVLLATMPNVDEIGIDRLTLGYTLALSLLTSVLFGIVPAWRAARGDFQDGLKESASGGGSRGTRRLRSVLVVAEVALSTVLLVGAGLLARSYQGLQRVDPGFDAEGVLTMTLSLPDYAYPGPRERLRFYEQVLERVERLPGVRAAGFVNVLPFSTYDRGTSLLVEGAPLPDPGREPGVLFRVASARYLEALRIPVLEGRAFEARDREDGPPVALVSRALAQRFFGPDSPIGRRVRRGRSDDAPWITIVGVVGDLHHSELTDVPEPALYLPLAQAPEAMMMLAVRSDGPLEEQMRAARGEILRLDPAQPVYHVKTLTQLVADSMLPRSTSAGFMLLFSALALVLAAVGVYGVVAYGVSQQAREFGVRVALGATPRDLLTLVLRHGLLMVGTGAAIGALLALAGSRLLGALLYGVTPGDPRTYALVAAVLALTGLAACGLPAWRASRVPAVTALRGD